ncbi:hypothetical protein DQ244_01760 [Blastococcus sp. TBT05-19]|uniref:DUF6779 domain-containing protein n=1 Tax=Blastococcus sp. TBT05-19 TaxID=2250581 RepID=UPI000DE90002|nr:DUF6779 domain-containing protein [Blastococcus sp. TBT05-19]RBY94114.1 hypothetical protein DQ244_01760 [Blastococcus sp. TBT05-19]
MPRREDDDVARGPVLPDSRVLMQAGGFVLAGVATLVVFLTSNPQLLRLAFVAVAWAFVLATFAAGRRGADRVRAAAREADLRRAYELELDREVAARREYELELENELRREAEDSMREELDALRGEIASLSGLRDEVARVSALRGELASLSGLREEIARVAALRDDVAGLASLRGDLGQIGALREDMGRLRAELAEQLSSEMLVERIVMRTQASRLPGEAPRIDGPSRTLDGAAGWSDDTPPRELTGGWPAIRLDEPPRTQQFEQVLGGQSWASSYEPVPPTTSFPAVQPTAAPAPPPPVPAPPTVVPSPPPAPARQQPPAYEPLPSYLSDVRYSAEPARPAEPVRDVPPAFDRHARAAAHESDPYLGAWSPRPVEDRAPHTVASPVVTPSPVMPHVPERPQTPVDWLSSRSLLDPPPAPPADDVLRRRRTDEPPSWTPAPEAAPTTERPAATPSWTPTSAGPDTSEDLARILAENGVTPSSGGRRRRRYREDGESDDVLARVLGRE